jgi:hypothetical protein
MGMSEEVSTVRPVGKRDFPRESGPVEQLGPITLPRVDWGKARGMIRAGSEECVA